MPTQIGNFIAQNFRGPRPADVALDRSRNALYQNQADRIPQQNRMQDQAIQAQDLEINDAQRKNAAGVLGRNFAIAAQSPRPRDAARALVSSADFQTAGKLVGLPVDQFTITDQDTDDTIRQQLQTWAQALGASGGGEAFTLSAGQTRFGPGGQPLASTPAAPPSLTDDQREYADAVKQGFKGTIVDYMTMMRRAGATTIDMTQRTPPPPQGMVYEPDQDPNNRLGYKLVPIPGARDPRTEAQQKAGLLSARMRELSSDVVDTAPTITTQMIASVAQGGGMTGGVANSALTPAEQKHFNAARGWLAGVLRQDTGATIQPFEIAEYYPTFFPVPGDSSEVIAQKRRLRAVTEQAISANSGAPQNSADGSTEAPAGGAAPEGTVVQNANGQTMIKRNGRWWPQNNAAVQ